ncbi:MAG TPA: avidin/streptavidin family protein [Candidatus Acidoferrales bacterium]|nr:avidin/streptavidin family protein [Candidatus Acidoferrales bacterium]
MSGNDPLDGVWYSGVGSKLELSVKGSELSGYFHSKEGPGGKYRLIGSIDPDPDRDNRALSFSVSWITPDTPKDRRSVTSYTGQYHRSHEVIRTIFLLADETSPTKQYVSTFVGYDNFSRMEPAADLADKERKLGTPHSKLA